MSKHKYPVGSIKNKYNQSSIKKRIEAFLLDNIGHIVTREMLIEVSKNPSSGKEPENWHQRLSELRTDNGYTILSKRDLSFLSVDEYILESAEKRPHASSRVTPSKETWNVVLARANNCCEWNEGGQSCGLQEGDNDPVGGGTVKLTADHKTPHSINPKADPLNPDAWQALCGRHQVTKRNYWDSNTGKINTRAIVQAATRSEKEAVYADLKRYFGED